MTARVEVLPGPGVVFRFGPICMWAGPQASDALLQFLGQSGRNLGPSARGGQLLAEHVGRVLESADPEPGAPFLTLGPDGTGAMVALLHGPVQVWTGSRWVEPPVDPGWSMVGMSPAPVILAGAAGTQPVPGGSHPVLDLEAGAVPGGGFALIDTGLPERRAVTTGVPSEAEPAADDPPARPDGDVVAAAFATQDRTGIDLARPTGGGQDSPTTVIPAVSTTDATAVLRPGAAPTGGPAPVAAGDPDRLRPPGAVGLLPPPGGLVPEPPAGPVLAVPVVRGVRCGRGHFNHPDAVRCARCREPIDRRNGESSGPRPPLGVLVVDDGALYALDRRYLLGRRVGEDPAVAAGRARALVLDGERVADSHAELRLDDWTVTVLDRAGSRSTHVLLPGSAGWATLAPHQPTVLPAGGHLAVGSRVLTFVSPWPG